MYPEQLKDEPKAQACPKCNGNMLARNYLAANNAVFTRSNVRLPITFAHTSGAKAMVCDNCGYAEIYAVNPEKLRELRSNNYYGRPI